MAEVELDGVSKTYPNGVQAVREFSLHIENGELFVLLGPSGSGKTTLLRLIAGLEQPTAGTIRIDGKVVNERAPRDRNVAMIFQRPALYPHLTVRKNLEFGLHLREDRGFLTGLLRWRGRPSQDLAQRVNIAARDLGLQDLLERRPHELSGGEQQRVALGRAVVRRPRAFLLDEPLTHLDEPSRLATRRQLHLLQRRLGATMIYVTHDQAEAMALSDRIAVLESGKVRQVGEPASVYHKPCDRFVAGFLGSPRMNFLHGRLLQADSGLRFVAEDWSIEVPESRTEWHRFAPHEVTLGVRPQDILLEKSLATAGELRMEVVLVEPAGSGLVVMLKRGGSEVTALVNSLDVMVGQCLGVRFNLRLASLFDRATGVSYDAPVPSG